MDPKLAEIYGTNQVDETDVEKLAAAALVEKLAGDEDVTEGMSDEEIEALAAEIVASESGEEEPEVEEPEKTAEVDEAQEKVAEADYLGRVMAHAYVQELKDIEKTAGLKDMAGKAGSKAKAVGGKVGGFLKAHKKKSMGAGAAALGAGAGYMAYKKMKSKKASAETEDQLSALDTLALAHAKEILKANGIDPATDPEQPEKTASAEETSKYDILGKAVEKRAVEMLTEAGYSFKEGNEEGSE